LLYPIRIKMLSINEQKEILHLLKKKHRIEQRKFLVEGKKLILEAVDSKYKCEIIIYTNQFLEGSSEFINNPKFKSVRKELIKQIDFERFSDIKTPQGVVAVFKVKEDIKKINSEKIIALENISDPGNLGTIVRNCDWFGFNNIILSDDCAEILSPKVIRSSAGSVFHLNIKEEKEFYNKLITLKKEQYKILCTDLDGKDLYRSNLPDKYVIVLCNEANGPSKKLLEICDYKITIPRKGNAESLNVASASAVILSFLSQ